MQDPQFAGQTKERLSSRQCAAFVSGVVKDAFSLWLNQNVQAAEQLAELAISSAQRRMRAAKVVRKTDQWPGTAWQTGRLYFAGLEPHRAIFGGRGFRRRFRETSPRPGISGDHAVERQDLEHLGGLL